MHAALTDGRPADVVVKATTVDAPIASRARAQFFSCFAFSPSLSRSSFACLSLSTSRQPGPELIYTASFFGCGRGVIVQLLM